MIIKKQNDDFIVEEVLNERDLNNLQKQFSENNPFAYFILEKDNFNTMSAMLDVARYFKTTIKNTGFCGNKDKNAITKQYISIKINTRILNKVQNDIIVNSKIKLIFQGYSNKPLFLGAHELNKFKIRIREISQDEYKLFNINKEKLKNNKFNFLNIYGEQRFSTNNIEIGKLLVKRDFKKSFELLVKNYQKLGKTLSENLVNNDYVNSIKTIPNKLLSIYVNAYQSYLWNNVAKYADSLIQGKFNFELPIYGFATDLDEIISIINSDIKKNESNTKNKQLIIKKQIYEYYKKLVFEEQVSQRDFVIKQISSLSSEGGTRNIYQKVTNFCIDELNQENDLFVISISFDLPKSSYATTVIEYLFQVQD